ncbi:MAG: hypothetical protein HGA38_05610, partial [Candidatus Moranbacteria bacterium]|nr:hypothetical protein [Candidatus Moranbacteria bacterium]
MPEGMRTPLSRLKLLSLVLIVGATGMFSVSETAAAATGINAQINFQGKVVNTDGTNVSNGNYDMIFRAYTVSSGGVAAWTETWNSGTSQVTVTDGVFQAALGTYTALPGSLDFNTDNIYLSVEFNGNGEMSPRIRFTAAPYAMNAKKVGGLTVTDTTGTLTVPNGKTISFGDAFTTSGAFPISLTASASTSLNLPTSGTLATLAGSEQFTNKTIGSTGLVFSGATTDIDAASGEGLAIQGRSASSFSTTSGTLTFESAGTGTTGTVQIGVGGSGSTAPDYFGLDVKSTTGDPSGGFEGAMYYNTYDNKFRCYQGAAWTDCIGSGTGGMSIGGSITSGTSGSVLYVNGSNQLAQDNSNFFWDATNKRLGLGTASPSGRLHSYVSNAAVTAASYDGYFENLATNTTTDAINKYGLYVTSTGSFTGSSGTATNNYGLYVNTPTGADNNYAAIFAGGNVGIGTASPSQQLTLTGSLAMPATTTSTTGVIYKGSTAFLHNFAASGTDGHNVFLGLGSG